MIPLLVLAHGRPPATALFLHPPYGALRAVFLLAALAFSTGACGAKSGLEVEPEGAVLESDPPPSPPPDVVPPPGTRLGQTWTLYSHDASLGVDKVGCDDACNPYNGDTPCSALRPILCVRLDGAANPGVVVDFYNGWIGGPIALTPPVVGTSLASEVAADALCALYVGEGFEMAQFHHPDGGWRWSGFGSLNGSARFWVRIRDQQANCWD